MHLLLLTICLLSVGMNTMAQIPLFGFSSIKQSYQDMNTTIKEKLQTAMDFVLEYRVPGEESSVLLSHTSTSELTHFFQFFYSIVQDNCIMTNFILDIARGKKRAFSSKKLAEHKQWLNGKFNFPPDQVYNFIKTISNEENQGIIPIAEVMKQLVIVLEDKYKVIKRSCRENETTIVKWFLKSGYLVEEIPFEDFQTAFDKGNKEIVIELLENGYVEKCKENMDLRKRNAAGDTLLHLAAERGPSKELVAIVERAGGLEEEDGKGLRPLYRAAMANNIENVRALMGRGATLSAGNGPEGDTVLHLAARQRHPALAELLLSGKLSPALANTAGETPLHLAVLNYDYDLMSGLHKRGADLNAKTRRGDTPLHYASRAGSLQAVQLLLPLGAEPAPVNLDGLTPLHEAIRAKHLGVVKEFLRKDSSLMDSSTEEGDSIMHLALTTRDVRFVSELLAMGAPANRKNNLFQTALFKAALQGNQEMVNLLKNHTDLLSTNSGMNMLHEAASMGSVKGVTTLLNIGFHIDGKGMWGNTPLHFAAGQGNVGVVRLLLEKKAEKNTKNKNMYSPLHIAVSGGHLEVVQLLVRSCANTLQYKDKLIEIASKKKYRSVVDFLLNYRGSC